MLRSCLINIYDVIDGPTSTMKRRSVAVMEAVSQIFIIHFLIAVSGDAEIYLVTNEANAALCRDLAIAMGEKGAMM